MKFLKVFALVAAFSLSATSAFATVADDYGTTSTGNYCPTLSITMQRGARDASTSGQVSELQKFLSDYYDIDPQELVTGFFGRITEGYVQRFQKEQGLPTFGIAGSLTRAKIASLCASGTNTPSPTTTSENTTSSLSCKMSVSALTVEAGKPFTATWTTQNAVSVDLEPTYGFVAVNGSQAVTFGSAGVSNVYIIAKSATGSQVICSKQITVTPASSVSNPTQTNPVSISSFTVSSQTVASGQPVVFSWGSNLTSTDVSYYGGGCSITGNFSYNAAAQYNSGFKAGTASLPYTPPATGTYTLRCTSNAKDGSPSDTRIIAVTVTPAINSTTLQKPDLTATVSGPATGIVGQPVTISGTITNQGNASTVNWFTGVFVTGLNSSQTDWNTKNVVNSNPVNAGASNSVTTTFTWNTPGTYEYAFCADSSTLWAGTITESNESNNCSTHRTIVISAAPVSTSCIYYSNTGANRTATVSQSSTQDSCRTACTTIRNEVFGPTDSGICTFKDTAGNAYVMTVAAGGTTTTTPAPTCTLSSSKTSLAVGEVATLSWATANASLIALDAPGAYSTSASSGSTVIAPIQTTTYTLAVQNSAGASTYCTKTVTVTASVVSTAPSCSIAASPRSISVGGTPTLTWSSTNAVFAVIDSNIGAVPTFGSVVVAPIQTTTYSLAVQNSAGTNAYCTETVTVAAASGGSSSSSASSDGACTTAVPHRGQSGSFSCTCQANFPWATVYGTGTYTDDSNICNAALNNGSITQNGGTVTYTLKPGQASYTGSAQNGVSTYSYGAWSWSFGF